MEDIESGLRALVDEIRTRGIRSIAIPPLGAGLGGLSWPEVRRRIENALGSLDDLHVIVYEPHGAPDSKAMAHGHDIPKMTLGRASLIHLIHRYLSGLLDPFVTLLELQKLMYFLQEAGEPLDLEYVKHIYGPYARKLSHVLRRIEGHYVSGYADGGDSPGKQLELVPGAIGEAEAFLAADDETKRRLLRVYDLVEGFETPFGLELLATVHWAVMHEGARDLEDVRHVVHEWNERKRGFSSRQISIAFNVLRTKGWLIDAGSDASQHLVAVSGGSVEGKA